ncbi:hypothetical protein BGZ98_009530 [Dissophora globulifera]|nr:hypothetical protein BGZ98_009530 [Dissophora globulifera]
MDHGLAWSDCESQWGGNHTIPPGSSVPVERPSYTIGRLGQAGHDEGDSGPLKLPPDLSYLVATCYISLLSIMAIIMCFRVRTRLRCFACFCTYLGLSIGIMGLLWSLDKVSPNIFWLWNIIAESVGIVALTYTIVSVGNGFYPMAGNKNMFWRMAMTLILIYAIMATANIVIYAQQKVAYHFISGSDIQTLRQSIIHMGIKNETELDHQQFIQQCLGDIPAGNLTETGVPDWRSLPWALRDMQARPIRELYLAHQILMLLTWLWVSLYLFIPLVRNHRHGPVGRPVDSDMMAVGVWYLGCLLILTLAYAVLNIAYCANYELIYKQQIQALDLCIRVTIGPIFFLPAPAFLIRFYRQHFQRFGKGGRNVSEAPGGKFGMSRGNDSTGGHSGLNGSFIFGDRNGSVTFPNSMDSGRVDRYNEGTTNSPKASFDGSLKLDTSGIPSNTNNGVRFFHSRIRGASTESNKVFNQDFEQDGHSTHELDQYYNNISTYPLADTAGRHVASSPVLSIYEDRNDAKDLLTGFRPASMEPQKPEIALLAFGGDGIGQSGNSWSLNRFMAGRSDVEFASVDARHSKEGFDSAFTEKMEKSEDLGKKPDADVKRTMEWEASGREHVRQISESHNDSVASIVEQHSFIPTYANRHRTSLSAPLEEEEEEVQEESALARVQGTNRSVINNARPPATTTRELTGLQKQLAEYRSALLPSALVMHELGDSSTRELTGLQKQLAEYRSALLPSVLAMHELDDNSAPLSTADSLGEGNGRETVEVDLPRLHDETPSSVGRIQYVVVDREIEAIRDAIDEADRPADGDPISVHSVDPLHWAKLPPSPRTKPAFGVLHSHPESTQGQTTASTFRISSTATAKSGDSAKVTPGFRMKWLASTRKSNSEMEIPIEGQSGKTKDARRSVFSKVLPGSSQRSADRDRKSQDNYDHGKHHFGHGSDTATIRNSSIIPTTVESLAYGSTFQLEDKEEDKGLQYYYPDPYYDLTEFKRPQTTGSDQISSITERGAMSAVQRQTSSSIFVDDVMESRVNSPQVPITSAYNATTLTDPLVTATAAEALSSATSSSTRTKMSMRLLKKDKDSGGSVGSVLGNATLTAPGTGSTSTDLSPKLPSSSASPAALSSASSTSKTIGSKMSSRTGRSRSEVIPASPTAELPPTPTTPLPTTNSSVSSISEASSVSQPAPASLSPPPRQSWSRSKSFQNAGPSHLADLTRKTSNASSINSNLTSIDTRLAKQRGGSGSTPPSGVAPSSSGARTSLSSSLSSPISGGTLSPGISPIIDLNKDHQGSMLVAPTSSLTSPVTAPLMRSVGSTAGGAIGGTTNFMGKDKTGFSNTTMDLKGVSHTNTRHQRSVDNLTSAYYHRRAADVNGSGHDIPERVQQQRGLPSISGNSISSPIAMPVTPSSPHHIHPGFSYYGIASGGDESGRNSPTSLNSSYTPQLQKNKTSLDYSQHHRHSGSYSPSPLKASYFDTTVSNINLMVDDPWTQAMVARAQLGTGLGSGSATGGDAVPPSQQPYSQSEKQQGQPQLSVGHSGSVRSQSPALSPRLASSEGDVVNLG